MSSNNAIQVFNNEDFGVVRTIMIDGEPWFVANDVCKALEIDATSTRRLDEDEKNTLRLTQGTSGNPNVTVINESGLYSLVLGSRKPEAKAFKRWMTHEVIPSIRRTGQYGGALTSEQALILAIVQSDAPENRALALSEYREAITVPLQAVIEEQKPKVTYYDVVMRSDDLIPTTVIAKDYGFSASKLNSLLNEFGVQFKLGGQWFLYSKYAGCGYMHSVTSIARTGHVCMRSQWTQKGRKFVYDVMKKNGYLPLIEKAATAIY